MSTNTAPSIGPVLAGALNSKLSWRAVFWFLAGASGCCLIAILLSLPETCRKVVGDGSINKSRYRQVPFRPMQVKPNEACSEGEAHGSGVVTYVRLFVKCLFQKDKGIILFCLAVFYMAYTCLQASLSTLFARIYNFNKFEIGLIYIPFGVGSACVAYLTGISDLLPGTHKL